MVWNRLIRQSNSEFVLLLNNDTVPRGQWLEKLLEGMKDEKVAGVGAISNRAGGHQAGFSGEVEDKLVECTTLSGFSLRLRKSAFDEIGGFDEAYKLYGEERIPEVVYVNDDRDTREMEIYLKCYELGIPMLGVCRGAQLLCAYAGGSLVQDVNGHTGTEHFVETYSGGYLK